MQAVEAAEQIGKGAPAMGKDDAQSGKAVEHAREDQRADAQRGVESVLRNLRQRELRRPRRRHGLHRMDEDRRVELDRRMPELVQRNLARD